MRLIRDVRLIAAAACALLVTAHAPATGSTPTPMPVNQELKYSCQWEPRVKQGVPWTGDLTIRVNQEGLINGTYRSTSIRPDPFYGKIITVTGALTGGNNIRLSFGVSPNITIRGEVVNNGIHAVTTYKGGRVEFLAQSR